jgi:hypothetical protein
MPSLPSVPTPSIPPAVAEYQSTLKPASGAAPVERQWKMFRSSQGLTRVDSGHISTIGNPATQQMTVLDHAQQQFRVLPMPAAAPQMGAPAMPTAPTLPQASPPQVTDLGKSVIGGHAAEGKLFSFQPPKPPAMPAMQPPALPGMKPPALPGMPGMKPPALPRMPALPQAPKIPGVPAPAMPKSPAPPAAPPLPATPQTVEVWSSIQHRVPLLSKSVTSQGVQTSVCKNLSGAEPPASAFQIPAGYKMAPLPKLAPFPKSPAVPKLPALPKLPTLPKLKP